MPNQIVNNYFTEEDIKTISDIVYGEMESRDRILDDSYEACNDGVATLQPWFGRLQVHGLLNLLPQNIKDKAIQTAMSLWNYPEYPMKFVGITFIRWSNEFKKDNEDPFLGVHLDSNNDLGIILDYQLKSNTSWPIGIEKDVYHMSDNDMVYFYPTDQYHWRSKKKWQDGEYVDVIFFEFAAIGKPRTVQDKAIVDEIESYRDSLGFL